MLALFLAVTLLNVTLLNVTPLDVALLDSPRAGAWYAHLLAEGGYGRLAHERAAFLILERDGSLTLQPWPHGAFRHARFTGAVPERTVAILHTHPYGEPHPSANDRRAAQRLGIPVVVITTEGVRAANPDGSESVLTAARTPDRASGTSRGPSGRRTLLRR